MTANRKNSPAELAVLEAARQRGHAIEDAFGPGALYTMRRTQEALDRACIALVNRNRGVSEASPPTPPPQAP